MSNQFNRNKVLAHLDVINNYVSNGCLSSPVLVELDLTNVCNHDCPGCSGWRQEGGLKSYIRTDDAINIIEDCYSCGVKAITFTGGGDPTMHKQFDSIIRHASELGLQVGLITNGLALKEKHLENLIPHCEWIRVSWDASTPELHDKIHYNGDVGLTMKSADAFWKVVENTGMLIDYKRKNNYHTTIGCAFLVGSETKHEIVSFAKLAKETMVDYCQYRPFHYTEYDMEVENMMKEAKEKYESENFNVLFSEFKFNTMKDEDFHRSYDTCHGGHFVTHIAANYNVYVCCHLMFTDSACIGNLKNQSFTSLWRDSKTKQVIDGIDVHKCLPLCRNDSANRILDSIVRAGDTVHKDFL